jgi:quercetin dioxygenase-like cupin family protein
VQSLVADDSVNTTTAGVVTFEPGARSNWHLHPSGQLLLIISGKGCHQIEGQPGHQEGGRRKVPALCVALHGASEDSRMSHAYMVPNTDKGIVEWRAPVTDEEYVR